MKSCLVVDDGQFDRAIIKRCADAIGFATVEAASGDEALEHCRKKAPDCVLLDWEMKPLNGIETLNALRDLPGGNETCILLCTSNSHPSFIGHAMVKGANGYLVKPITPEKLKAKLAELNRLP